MDCDKTTTNLKVKDPESLENAVKFFILFNFQVVVVRNKLTVYTHKVDYEPMSVAIHPGMTEVAVGGAKVSIIIYFFK